MEVQQKMVVVVSSKNNSPRVDIPCSSNKGQEVIPIRKSMDLNLATIMSLCINMENAANKLTKKEMETMKKMIYRNQEVMDAMGKRIKDCFVNGIAELHHIPSIILLMSEIYKEYCLQEKMGEVSIDKMILFTIHSMIEYKYLPFAKNHEQLVDDIVLTSVKLLKYELDLKMKKGWFS